MESSTPTALSRQQRYEKKRYQKRKVEKAEYIKSWRVLHPQAKKKENAMRKERMGGRSRNGTKAERELLRKKQSNRCGICYLELDDITEIDHIMPLCRGGLHEIGNMQLVHASCNRLKGMKLMSQIDLETLWIERVHYWLSAVLLDTPPRTNRNRPRSHEHPQVRLQPRPDEIGYI